MSSSVRRTAITIILLGICAGARANVAITVATQPAERIDQQIENLADPDPTIRNAARDQLISIGDAARAALQRATRSDNPQLCDAARDVLAGLPWFQASDPPMAIELLRNYGNSGVPDRIGIVGRLGELPGSQQVLFRLLGDEMNEDVCWQVVSQLRQRPDTDTLAAARKIDLKTCGSAAAFLSGAAWSTPIPQAVPPTDRERGRQLLAKAIELETAAPSYDDGQLDGAFDDLVNIALDHDQPTEAIRLRRLQCERIGVNRDSYPGPFIALLSIYAQSGPLAGLRDDLTKYDRFLKRPEVLGVLSRVYRRAGSQMLAATFEQLSLATALQVSTQGECAAAFDTLTYDDLSAAQCRSILARGNQSGDNADSQARLRLSQLAARREDDALALSQLQLLLDDRKASDLSEEAIQIFQTQAAVHQLRLAEAKHDDATINQSIATLLQSESPDIDVCIEVMPLLKSRGRDAEATKMFNSAFEPLKKRLDEGDADPSLLNELAWLCARCNMHLADAVKWSREAVASMPASSADIDTSAEAFFRSGNAAEAARLERRAIALDPGDLFMRGQLRRFEAAAATQPVTDVPTTAPAETH